MNHGKEKCRMLCLFSSADLKRAQVCLLRPRFEDISTVARPPPPTQFLLRASQSIFSTGQNYHSPRRSADGWSRMRAWRCEMPSASYLQWERIQYCISVHMYGQFLPKEGVASCTNLGDRRAALQRGTKGAKVRKCSGMITKLCGKGEWYLCRMMIARVHKAPWCQLPTE